MHLAEPPIGLEWCRHALPTQHRPMQRLPSQVHPFAISSPSVQAFAGSGVTGGAGLAGIRSMHADGPPGLAGCAQSAWGPQQMSKQAPFWHSQPLSRRSPLRQALAAAGAVAGSGVGVVVGVTVGVSAGAVIGAAGGCESGSVAGTLTGAAQAHSSASVALTSKPAVTGWSSESTR